MTDKLPSKKSLGKSIQKVVIITPDQTTKTKKDGNWKKYRRWLKRTWSDEDSTLRRSLSVFMLVMYAFLGSGIFYGFEKDWHTYWQCLSYVNSIFTTIGYGRIRPETWMGKIFTMIYAVFGVPIMLIATSDLGLIMMYWSGKAWVRIRRIKRIINRVLCGRCMRHNAITAVIPADDSIYEKGKEASLPLSFAIFILLLWLLLSSMYFSCTNEEWNFFIAFYFLFISVSTIGLGDYTTRDDQTLTILDYLFIFGGISLFSLCVRLFIEKIESVDDKVAQQIINEYIESLQNSYAFDTSDGRMEESESKQRAMIQKMIRRKGGCMRFFIGKRVETKMLREYQKRANMRLKMTQTYARTRGVSCMVRPCMRDAQMMAGDSCLITNKIKAQKRKRHSSQSTRKA